MNAPNYHEVAAHLAHRAATPAHLLALEREAQSASFTESYPLAGVGADGLRLAGAHATGALWAAHRLGVVELTGEKLAKERTRLAEALQEAFQSERLGDAAGLSPSELVAQKLLAAGWRFHSDLSSGSTETTGETA